MADWFFVFAIPAAIYCVVALAIDIGGYRRTGISIFHPPAYWQLRHTLAVMDGVNKAQAAKRANRT